MTRLDDLRQELTRRLLAESKKLPTSTAGRLSRTAAAALRTSSMLIGRRLRGALGKDDDELDLDAMAGLVGSIGQLKGVAMKVGQIMSYIDIAVPEELRAALSVLQTHAPPMPISRVTEIMAEELGDKGRELATTLDSTPLAAASIGQVHKGKLPDGTVVAVKVQYPEVAKAIESDFAPAALGSMLSSIFVPGSRVDAFITEARERFLEETDYVHEAESQERFAALYSDHPIIMVPAVHRPWCSQRVLTTTFVVGVHLDAFLDQSPAQEQRDRLGVALFDFYIGTLFRHGLYNCDPHPGNYLFGEDGRMAMLDYGCTRVFDRDFVAKLAGLSLAIHTDDRDGLRRALVDLNIVKHGSAYDFETARALMRAFHGPMLEDEVKAIDLGPGLGMAEVAKKKRELLKLSLPGEFLFLLRIRFGLMSVLARLGSRANWHRLELEHLTAGIR